MCDIQSSDGEDDSSSDSIIKSKTLSNSSDEQQQQQQQQQQISTASQDDSEDDVIIADGDEEAELLQLQQAVDDASSFSDRHQHVNDFIDSVIMPGIRSLKASYEMQCFTQINSQNDVRSELRIAAFVDTSHQRDQMQLATVNKSGREVLRELWFWINAFCRHAKPKSIVLTKVQQLFMWYKIRAILRYIFRHDYSTEGLKYAAEMGWDGEFPFVQLLAERQIGKTTCIVIFACAVLMTIPYVQQNIWSTGKRISQMILARMLSLITSCPEVEKKMRVEHNVERIVVINGVTDKRLTNSFPGRGETSRGTAGRAIHYLDEAAHVDEKFIMQTLFPMLGDEYSVLIATTTVKGPDNCISKMAKLRDSDGNPVFNLMHVKAVCDRCANMGRAAECKHKTTEIPEFKSQKRLDLIRRMYAGNEDLYAQEMGGQIVDSDNLCFVRSDIDALVYGSPFRLSISNAPSNLFMMIDPSGGGASQLAIVTTFMAQTTGEIIVRF